jgi:pyruvate,water dikinase
LTRIGTVLALLKIATYYSILAPLSAALRKAIAKVPDHQIDNGDTPEVAALRELQELARKAEGRGQKDGETGRQGEGEIPPDSTTPRSQSPIPTTPADWFAILAETPDGEAILAEFDRILERYGYLSEVGTDIAVPTWREEPQPVRELFTQFCLNPAPVPEMPQSQNRKNRRVQQRFRLKGRVTEIYSRLLAELRWSFVALEQHWLETGLLQQPEDIFFLEFEEVRHLLQQQDTVTAADVAERIAQRRLQLERDRQLDAPYLIYGDDPPVPLLETRHWQVSERLQGIAASPGQAEGRVRIVRSLQTLPDIDRSTILVVPYTDSGWAPLLARAGGLIAEVGGRLSHGAIVAREYRIPAVMDVHNATQRLRDGQLIRIDGQQGIVEIL